MFDGTYIMFDKFQRRLGKVKKADYERHFTSFMEENRACYEEMFQYVGARDDKEAAAKEVAVTVFDNMTQQYGKRGKLPRNFCIDMSIYLIYYFFTAILKLENECSDIVAVAMRDEWRIRSNNPLFDYTTFDEVYKGFKEKLFGFF